MGIFKPGRTPSRDSIAVMPFANLSGDPAQAYFSDGIAEELRGALPRIARLEVIGRTSSDAVRELDDKAPQQARRRQHIDRQRPPLAETIRISAQLVGGDDRDRTLGANL